MDAPKMKVQCSVTNCHYNKEKMCHADHLDVDSMGDNKVETSGGTQCSTFKKHNTATF